MLMRNVSLILIAFLALALADCGYIRAQQQAESVAKEAEQVQAEYSACLQQFPAGPRHNNVALARCLGEVDVRHWTDAANRDLLDLYLFKRIAVATRMDQGSVTQEDGAALIAQTQTEAISEYQRRTNADRSTAAQQQAAAAANAPRFSTRNGNSISCF
jgi:hypothetical protein